MRVRLLLAVLVVLAVLPAGATGTPAVGDGSSVASGLAERPAGPFGSSAPATVAESSDDLSVTYLVSLTPDDPGHIDVTVRFDLPASVDRLEVRVRPEVTVTDRTAFDRTDQRVYEWTGSSRTPSITYRKPVNVTVASGAEGRTAGGHLYVDVGEWALVREPSVAFRYAATSEQTVTREVRPVGTGFAGDSMVFLGPYDLYTDRAAGQRFRLVVPAAANLTEPPEAILASVGRTAERVTFGPRDETVTMFAAPSDGVTWGSTGLERGESDFWVRDQQRLDTPQNVWVHEYVHTRQVYQPTSETRWTIEATADYYAALFAYETRGVSYDSLRRHLREGRADRYADAVLADPPTWEGTAANYWKGALVLAAIDRQIRLHSDGTLQDVFARVDEEGRVTETEFLDAVEAVGGSESRAFARQHTRTSEAPTLWNRTEHRVAFGPTSSFAYEFQRPVTVTGPYRSGPLESGDAVVPNETLGVTATVRNVGDATGSYEATLYANDAAVATRTGSLDAGSIGRLEFDVPVSEVGDLHLRLRDASTTVPVVRPATPTVTGVEIPATARADGTATVRVSLRNEASRPAARKLAFAVDGSVVDARVVRVAPGASSTVEQPLSLSPGEHRVSVADRAVTVRVTTATTTPGASVEETTASPTAVSTAGSGPGFGLLGTLVTLLLAGGLARFARRRS